MVEKAGLLAWSMYVDLNPVRAATIEKPEQSVHTWAYDRAQGGMEQHSDSAGFDVVPVTTDETGKTIRQTPFAELQQELKAKKRNRNGRLVRRDVWLLL